MVNNKKYKTGIWIKLNSGKIIPFSKYTCKMDKKYCKALNKKEQKSK